MRKVGSDGGHRRPDASGSRGPMSVALAANDAAFSIEPHSVRVLHLNVGAERVQRANEDTKTDELWVGTAFAEGDQDDDIGVYLRLAQPQPIAAELVCSVIGRALGLPVPEPFIITIGRGVLTGSGVVDATTEFSYAFASEDVGGGTFAQLMRGDSAFANGLLRSWKHLVPLAAFDEWLANTDRNLGNILYVANSLWLIDHADAFGGSARKLFSLTELTSDAFSNKVGQMIELGFSAGERLQHLDAAKQWLLQPASALSIDQAISCAGLGRWQTAAEQTELIDFVTHRLTLTHTLLCNRLGHPQLALPPTPSVDNVPVVAAQSLSTGPA